MHACKNQLTKKSPNHGLCFRITTDVNTVEATQSHPSLSLSLSSSLTDRNGDIAMLQVDAVVNPTNESLTDKNPISLRLLEVAGPELRDACKTQVGSE